MKNNINILNALNKSLEEEFKAKRKAKLKEAEEHIDSFNGYSLYKIGKSTQPGYSIYKIVNDETKEEKTVGLEDNRAVSFFRDDTKHAWKLEEAAEDDYMLLDRLRSDCEYYLGAGNRNPKYLWAGNVKDQIDKMKEIYNSLKEKPEWLTMEDIENYEKRMMSDNLKEAKNNNFQTLINNLKMMDKVMRSLNDEELFYDQWLSYGIPDEASEDDLIDIINDNDYNRIEKVFKNILEEANKNKPALYSATEEELNFAKQYVPNITNDFGSGTQTKFNEASFKDKVSAIKKSLKKRDKRVTNKSAQKSAEKIAGSMIKKEAQEFVITYIPDNNQKDKTASISVQGNNKQQATQQARQTIGNAAIVSIQPLVEDETIVIPNTEVETDYIINDVTVLDNVRDGDVQAPDMEALLTLIDESLKSKYSNEWGRIKTLSSSKNESYSYALVDISTPEVLKEFESKGITDVAIGKNLILENINGMYKFKVNNLNGTTKYSKVTTNPQQTIYEWIESEFLQEAKEEKAKEAEILKAKTEKETVENYIANRIDLKQEIENIKMFIDLSKQVKAQDEMKPSIQDRMYAFAVEMPQNIEIKNNDDKYELSFSNLDQVVEMIFGKEWVKEKEEIPEVINYNKSLTEAYEQFNIGNIEVVFNPDTYECLYSIPSADVKDKKINLTKVPTVDTPYDTNTIIKDYIETRFGRIPSEEQVKNQNNIEKEQPSKEIPVKEPNTEVTTGEEISVSEKPVEEAELPDEPGDEIDTGIDLDNSDEDVDQETEEAQAETGSAVFYKIRPNQHSSIEDVREKSLDGDTPQSNYIVVDTIDLAPEQFNDFISDFSKPQSFLTGIQSLDRKNYSFNVVKITSSAADYVLLVDPLGYDYRSLHINSR